LLYINDSPGALIDVYNVNNDGTLSHKRRFANNIGNGNLEEGIPDGMKCDELGNIWVTGPGGIWVIDPDGKHLGIINFPENCHNLAWGNKDWKTLYVTGCTSLYSIQTKVKSHEEPFMV